MNELEKIKRVEDEVSEKIEKARQASVQSIADAKAKGDQLIQEEIENAQKEASDAAQKAESLAKKDAEKVISEGKVSVSSIQLTASKNEKDVVGFVVKKLRGE